MRTGLILAVLVLFAISRSVGRAQQTTTNGVTTVNSTASLHQTPTADAQKPAPLTLRLGEPKDTNSMEFRVSKETQLRLSGPLVRPLKAKTPSGFLGRVVHWFNPLATGQPNVPPAPSGPMNTRAWTTIAGWSPGHSAFPSAGAWNEPTHLDLISISTEKQP